MDKKRQEIFEQLKPLYKRLLKIADPALLKEYNSLKPNVLDDETIARVEEVYKEIDSLDDKLYHYVCDEIEELLSLDPRIDEFLAYARKHFNNEANVVKDISYSRVYGANIIIEGAGILSDETISKLWKLLEDRSQPVGVTLENGRTYNINDDYIDRLRTDIVLLKDDINKRKQREITRTKTWLSRDTSRTH